MRTLYALVLAGALGSFLTSPAIGGGNAPQQILPGAWAGFMVTRLSGDLAKTPFARNLAKPAPIAKCISVELARQGPLAVMFDGADGCQLDNVSYSGTRLTATRTCLDRHGTLQRSKLIADISPDHIQTRTLGQLPSGAAIEVDSDLRRQGACS